MKAIRKLKNMLGMYKSVKPDNVLLMELCYKAMNIKDNYGEYPVSSKFKYEMTCLN